MKKIKSTIFACTVALSAIGLQAQEASRSGYFLEGNNFRHMINPAFAPEQNYISIPVLANMGIGIASNVGVNTFIYKLPDGNLTTFMNSSVSSDEFLGKINKNNKVTANIHLTLLSAGFRAFNGYNTISISARSQLGMNLPKDLLTFMKIGQNGPDTHYNFKDIRVAGNAFGEIAFGHQHKINNELSIGAKIKFMLGAGNINTHIKNMDVRLNTNQWLVKANGQMDIAAGSKLILPTNYESGKELDNPELQNQFDYDGIDYEGFGMSGFGIGFDLGATYDMHNLVEGLTLSAALTDLGFISWSNNINAATPGKAWTFDGFKNVSLDNNSDNDENSLDSQLDDMWDGLKKCANFERKSTGGSRTTALNATFTLGAEYKMPFYQKLTGGFLFTQHFAGCFSWSEGRFSANLKPTSWFGMSVNYAASTFGSSFGWMLNYHGSGYTIFLGSDHQFFKITPQFIPVGKASANITLGMSITFGAKA